MRAGAPGTRFDGRGPVPRLVSHYRNAFESLLVAGTGYHRRDDSLLLHRLLLGSRPALPRHPPSR